MKPERSLAKISKPLSNYRTAMGSGDYRQAITFADTMIAQLPGHADLYACRAEARLRGGDAINAANDFAEAHNLQPDEPQYLVRFGDALDQAGERDGAESCFRRALQLDGDCLTALLGLGRVLEALGRPREAAPVILQAVRSFPDSALACHAAGRFLHIYGSKEDAIPFFRKAIENDPTLPDPYRVLANYLRETKHFDDAITLYNGLLEIVPGDAVGHSERAHCLAHINDWTDPGYANFDPGTPEQLQTSAGPFQFLALEDAPERLLERCKRYAHRMLGGITPAKVKPTAHDRIRVGYFSADFHDHATMHLLAGMLEAHDRAAFELFAYSFGPDHDDTMRARAIAAVDHFHDISGMDDRSAAEFARAHELDIAIDLKGFTSGQRIAIFGHRVAPVQMTWLGFPGSTGADCMDVILADTVVIPPELAHAYSEKVVRMPQCYQPNDRARPLPDPALTRADVGLPEDAFVFCSFNSPYKISPAEFDIWMELLREIDGAVLWQLTGGDASSANLRKAAEARGVDPSRIIIAPRLDPGPHLSRVALADLFLDTFNCNAHTTASDALWAGVPVLTKPGRQFAARVAASLVTAAGTPETVCADTEAYRDTALALARDPERLAELKARLIAGRDTCALFDTERFTRDFESVLRDCVLR
ncbi:tetratricopeptide repeat protein [Aliishimia ponticola]|uniref:protein O-GlcNAc transferase n=1 Tax=Aliishimia ponticola TaxID=2499833 RepID=A0A4S4NGN7_9RHOB|nr:tetratricopeptide repeat protein [Aliishimia ponticola]THH37328.1 tetratricopeptide repeat protein [Aliishimia ponticola]